jgi:hypothetical protein
VARRFQTNPLLVDLVGEENTGRLADTIKLLVMQVCCRGGQEQQARRAHRRTSTAGTQGTGAWKLC